MFWSRQNRPRGETCVPNFYTQILTSVSSVVTCFQFNPSKHFPPRPQDTHGWYTPERRRSYHIPCRWPTSTVQNNHPQIADLPSSSTNPATQQSVGPPSQPIHPLVPPTPIHLRLTGISNAETNSMESTHCSHKLKPYLEPVCSRSPKSSSQKPTRMKL